MIKKPNIVFILSDDQGAWALNCAGNYDLHTPNIDKLANNGIRFENFFCASPVCSPARASIFTGMIPSAHGVVDWLRGGNIDMDKFPHLKESKNYGGYGSETKAIQYLEEFTSFTDLLNENGYTCALSGKWHLGDSVTPQHGFKKWYTIGRGGCNYFSPDIVENGEINVKEEYVTDLITENALKNIDELSKEDNPFYLSVHYTSPHSPWDEDNHQVEYLDMYRDCEFRATPDLPLNKRQINSAPHGVGEKRKELLRGYYASITSMDNGIGKIVQSITDAGLLDNTIFFFTSDNGMNMGHHGLWGKGNATFPPNLYDTSVKVPFIISYNKAIAPSVCKNIISHYDLFPTIREYLHLSGDVKQNLIGKSFNGILNGYTVADDEDIVVFDEYGCARMIRNKSWKYIHRYPYGPNEFYNLEEDKEELNNLFHTDLYRDIMYDLRDKMEKFYYKNVDKAIDATKEPLAGWGQISRVGIYANGRDAHADMDRNCEVW